MEINIENTHGLPELWISSVDGKIDFWQNREVFVVLYDKKNQSVIHQGSCYALVLKNNRPGITTTARICGLGNTESMLLEVVVNNDKFSTEDIVWEMHKRALKKGDTVAVDGGAKGMVRDFVVKDGIEYASVEVLDMAIEMTDEIGKSEGTFGLHRFEVPTNKLSLV